MPKIPLKDAIEGVRRRLMRADAVLGCVAFAFMHTDTGEEGGVDYADAIGVGRRLVEESIEALDPVALRLR